MSYKCGVHLFNFAALTGAWALLGLLVAWCGLLGLVGACWALLGLAAACCNWLGLAGACWGLLGLA